MIIYYSAYRVSIVDASDNKAKNRFVSTLKIHHMVYTDTGETL